MLVYKEEEEMERSIAAPGVGVGVALFPSPFKGHILPMFYLAYILHSKGFSITIIHTHFNSPNPNDHPSDFRFVSIDDIPGDIITSGEDSMAFIIALNAKCDEPFRNVMASLLQSSSPRVSCLIVDAQLYFTRQVAEQFHLQRIVLRTSSAASFRAFAGFPDFVGKCYIPIQGHIQEALVPEMPPLRMKDLPRFNRSELTNVNKVLTLILKETRSSPLVIMNTSEALERNDLAKLQFDLGNEVFPMGPLHKVSPYPLINCQVLGMKSDTWCIKWLDEQPPRSVLYVSFGSLACMNEQELMEMAWGLANSKQRFLWVIRVGLVRDMEFQSSKLLKDFESEVIDRGRIIQWAPQQVVLQHNAVGGFWTHCGWNSILESIYEGVPMICFPFFGDQFVNARFVSYVWKVGIQMECRLERDVITKVIQRLMTGKEGKEIMERARLLKCDVNSCIEKGDSIQASIEKLLNHILEKTTTSRTS